MIVVDSSAFIEYYRPGGDQRVAAAVAEAIAGDEVAVNGIIHVEIVAFASAAADRELLAGDFEAFHWLEIGRGHYERAAELGFSLRRKGLTVPATDLIVAVSAMQVGAMLYHVDGHYDQIAEHADLHSRHLRP